MNIYECSLYERGTFSDTLIHREFLFSFNEETAKKTFCETNGYRKNKKGIEVEKIETVIARRKKTTKTAQHREYYEDYRCAGYTTRTERVKVCICSHCKGETSPDSQLCTSCGAVFM